MRTLWALRKWFLLAAMAFVVFVAIGFFYGLPGHPVNVFVFKLLYITSINKKPFLSFYSPARRDVNAGTIPPEVDEFLCERAETAGESEIEAIADFYALQSGGRQGGCIYLVSDRTAERLIGHLISRIEDETNGDVAGEISIVEQIRTRQSLGKGGLNSAATENRPSTAEEWESWKYSVALPIARQRYSEWWNSHGTWKDKRRVFALDGTTVTVTSCCG